MLIELKQTSIADVPRVSTRSAVGFPLPPMVVLTERGTSVLRAELINRGCGEWIIFYAPRHDLYDVETHLKELGESASWEPLPGLASGEAPDTMTFDDDAAYRWPAGLLFLEQHQVTVARWYWADEEGRRQSLQLVGTASREKYQQLRMDLLPFRRDSGEAVWQMIYGGHDTPERVPRGFEGPRLMLPEEIRQRIDIEVVKFFTAEVVALYRSLGVPHRRGLMLYGPPGNGKTSLIRWIGSLVPAIPALVLRASSGFETDDLEEVIKRWQGLAPAILVIEDLDWLLKAVNVSMFLNILDGILPSADGMLLIATTNHPDQLDTAINNRPGRFDVSIEMPNPDRELREQFFASRLASMLPDSAIEVARLCDGLSFAHLQEVLRLSGLLAINTGRTTRTDDDLHKAAEIVQAMNQTARNGFPRKLEVPFGLVRRKPVSNS